MAEARAPVGLSFLVLFDLFAGIGCCSISTVSFSSAASTTSADTLATTALAIAGASMLMAVICLRANIPLGWRLGSIAQLVSGVAYATRAFVTFWLSQRPNPEGRYTCGLQTLADLAHCAFEIVLAAVSFVGSVYLLQPGIKQAFGYEASERGERQSA